MNALLAYGTNTSMLASGDTTDNPYNFNAYYNVLGGAFFVRGLFGNNCISYVDGALQAAGVSGQLLMAAALPENDAGSASILMSPLSYANGGSTETGRFTCGNNDEYTCEITGQYSAPDENGVRRLSSDTWTSSNGSSETLIYSAR